MQVLVSSEQRFDRTPDGAVWTANINAYAFWKRYLEAFTHVRVIARVHQVDSVAPEWVRADGENVEFHAVPYYLGPAGYVRNYYAIRRVIAAGLHDCEAVIMRVPSAISHVMTDLLRKTGHPFALEVVGDPYDVFSPGAVRHPARAFFRRWYAAQLRRQCLEAKGVAYVTAQTLQRRYPCAALMAGISDVELPEAAFTTTYSSVDLSSSQILESERVGRTGTGPATLIFVGSLAQLYKAPDVLLQAVAKAVGSGCDLSLNLVGDGRYSKMLQDMAEQLGIGQRCTFLGALPAGNAVQAALDSADIFILPSRVEGLPRAMIEAMARGLPCIGTTIGGIPELLSPEDLAEPGDVAGLAKLIQDVVSNPERQRRMSARNLSESRKYANDVLHSKRIAFYRYVEQATAYYIGADRLRQNASGGYKPLTKELNTSDMQISPRL
jgi:glycosyltransferase involved in cell wall biosynthesis